MARPYDPERREFLKKVGKVGLVALGGSAVAGSIVASLQDSDDPIEGPRGNGLSGFVDGKYVQIGRTNRFIGKGPVYLVASDIDPTNQTTVYLADPVTLQLIEVLQGRFAPNPTINHAPYSENGGEYGLITRGFVSYLNLDERGMPKDKQRILKESQPEFDRYLNAVLSMHRKQKPKEGEHKSPITDPSKNRDLEYKMQILDPESLKRLSPKDII